MRIYAPPVTRSIAAVLVALCSCVAVGANYDLLGMQSYDLLGVAEASPVSEQSKQRSRQIYLFTASWCPPCQQFKRLQQPRMEASGWTFGSHDDVTTHFRIVDSDTHPALVDAFNVSALPTFVLSVDGEPAGQMTGYRTAEQLAELYTRERR